MDNESSIAQAEQGQEEVNSIEQDVIFGDPVKGNISFVDRLYEEIMSVIGGNNPNQFFCMGLPGTLINASQYSYDIEKNEPKPAHVVANESKLVNKLFDACKMTSSDNGRHLQTQYKMALDMLMPKLNGKLFDAKTKLREVLMTPYPYNFGDGDTSVLTLSQVFYRLNSDYIDAKEKWAQKQIDKKNELAKLYPGQTDADYSKRNDEFLDWYETIAEAEVLGVEEKLGKVLSVFSPGDMEIIAGILDSGAGREIAEARSTLANVGRLTPDGGFIYPVTLYPENWFTLLDTSFTEFDLLDGPAALSEKLAVLVAQRSKLTANINSFLSMIPEESEVKALKDAYDKSDEAYKEAFKALGEKNIGVTIDMLKTLADVMASGGKEKADEVESSTAAKIFGIDVEKAKGLLTALGDNMQSCLTAQNDLVDKAKKATTAAMEYFAKKSQVQFAKMLSPLKQQLEEVNDQISELQDRIKVSMACQPQTDNDTIGASFVAPNKVPENFTQLIITASMKEANQASVSQSSASSSSFGASFFFGGYSYSSSHQKAVSEALGSETDATIQIGMSVAKVQIGREWFEPGVFLLTSDMYNTASEHISPQESYEGFTDKRLNDMNKCVFPCFPASFIIARDITIRFSSSTALSSAFTQSIEDHSANGGGFFIFSGSSSSASASSQSNSSARSTANSVTVRFKTPQILGYYLEATPIDKSESISGTNTRSNSDFISIFEFIQEFQKMLDDHNKKYNRQVLNLQ